MMKRPKICPVRREPSLSNFSTIFQKGTDGINEVSRLKNDNFTVRPEMHVHACCRKNYISTPGVTSSSAEVSYKKTRTSSGWFNFTVVILLQWEKRKLRNHVMSLVRTERLIKQSISFFWQKRWWAVHWT